VKLKTAASRAVARFAAALALRGNGSGR
jgi:hypothetical protein